MSITKTTRALVVLVIGIGVGVPAIAADDSLARAKGLYASAAYDEALAELDRLENAGPVEDHTSVAEYRVFCLLALDRRDEARRNIDRLLHDNPHYFPSPDRTSPRIQSVFREVRRETLPKIVIERYAIAKGAFERKDARAAEQFEEVLVLLNDPDLQATTALKDLKEVATAFRDLTRALAATAPAAQAPSGVAPQPAVANAPVADIIYTSADSDVTPPVARSQPMPPWRPSSALEKSQEFRGAIRLLIDQSGAVVSATMPSSARPAYDQQLLRAAKEWKFTPARKDGVPVKYLKLIEVRLQATTP
jgi:hypothetical protein